MHNSSFLYLIKPAYRLEETAGKGLNGPNVPYPVIKQLTKPPINVDKAPIIGPKANPIIGAIIFPAVIKRPGAPNTGNNGRNCRIAYRDANVDDKVKSLMFIFNIFLYFLYKSYFVFVALLNFLIHPE